MFIDFYHVFVKIYKSFNKISDTLLLNNLVVNQLPSLHFPIRLLASDETEHS